MEKSPQISDIFDKNRIISESYFSNRYVLKFENHSGRRYDSKICFMFPGQGSAFPGMFRNEYFKYRIIREKFELADKFAKKLGFQNPSDYILTKDIVSDDYIIHNLSLFTSEVALAEVLMLQGIKPDLITGHSFGEFAALVASGIVPFEQMLELIYYRDIWCPKPFEIGQMLAVNANALKIKKLLKGQKHYISNINSPKQTVISAQNGDIEAIKSFLNKNSIRFRQLDIPQPYHTNLLSIVESKISELLEIKPIRIETPRIPFFSSVSKKLIDNKNFNAEDIKKIISKQIVTPVDFIYQIKKIYSYDFDNFVEVGPRDVLSGFIKDINIKKTIKLYPVTFKLTHLTGDNFKQQIEAHNIAYDTQKSNILNLVNKVIGLVTGYEIERISLEDRFGEDLGIDSIKKAEIVFTVLEKSKIMPSEEIDISGFHRIKDLTGYLEKRANIAENGEQAQPAKKGVFKRYEFKWKSREIEKLYLDGRKENFIVADINAFSKNKEHKSIKNQLIEARNSNKCNIIIVGSGKKLNFYKKYYKDFINELHSAIFGFIDFIKDVLVNGLLPKNTNIFLVTKGSVSPFVSGIVAFMKSLKKEYPIINFKHINFENDVSKEEMLKFANIELYELYDVEVLYRGKERYVPYLAEIKNIKNSKIKDGAVIVAIGGAKGITFSLLKEISKKYRPIIYIIGRSDKKNKIVNFNLAELRKHNKKVYYKKLDAIKYLMLDNLFETILKVHGKIDLIINGAGIERSSLLVKKSRDDMSEEIDNKVLSTFNILHLSLKYKPKRIVIFSSIISKFGNSGQTIYACSNEITNSLVKTFNKLSRDSFAVALNWPPWNSVGMTENKAVLYSLKKMNISLLNASRANKFFAYDVGEDSKVQEVIYFDNDDYERYNIILKNLRYLSPILGDIQPNYQNVVFMKSLSLKEDTYLTDHRINGVVYVPAAVSICMALEAARLQSEYYPYIYNFEIKNPLIVTDSGLNVYTELKKHQKGMSCKIRNNIVSSTCRIKSIKKQNGSLEKLGPLKEIKNSYLIYGENALFHGPSFQCIEKIFIDNDDSLIAKIYLKKLRPMPSLNQFGKIVQLLDAAFQSLALKSMLHERALRIPTRIDKIEPHFKNHLTKIVYVLASIDVLDSKFAKGDVKIINSDRKILFEMEGVTLKTIKNLQVM